MKAEDRRSVLWIGDAVPTELKERLDTHELSLQAVDETTYLELAPSARALVIEFDGDSAKFLARVRRLSQQAIEHGLLVVLCHRTDGQAVEFQNLQSKITAHTLIWSAYQKWEEVAYRAAAHQPGPGANSKLTLAPSVPNLINRLIMQRAFWDFDSLTWEELSEQGLSGARVFIVQPSRSNDPHDCELPKLFKIGPIDDIRKEADVFVRWVRDTVPFNYRPNIVHSRTIFAREQAAIVQDFVEPAIPLATAFKNGGAATLAASLFDGALGNWRSASSESNDDYLLGSISRRLDWGMSKAKPKLHDAMNEAGLLTGWPSLDKLKSIPYQRCRIHGDLHAGNVFVGARSGDCILIDFARCETNAASLDPAALEVHLVLTAHDSKHDVDGMYRWPIGTPKLSRDWLPNAVRSIRTFALAMEHDTRAYGLALADQLLRYASFPQPSLKRRALAVTLADQLLTAMVAA